MHLHFLELKSHGFIPHLEKMAQLRLDVFREYPYLYEGSLNDEQQYLESYIKSTTSLVVLAMDGESAIGATTCLKLSDADPGFSDPFQTLGYDLDSICYFGESILMAAYRGQGIGKQFFTFRENHARRLGCTMSAFCSVDRPTVHPLRPPLYRELDGFWQSQGYSKRNELKASFSWKEVGYEKETVKKLTFWTKPLDPLPA